MIIRVYIACLLSFACAEDITRVQDADGEGGPPIYYLEEIEVTLPEATPEGVTLKDVQFINKISETVSLLVTDKNVTWRYDEVEDVIEVLSFAENSGGEEDDCGSNSRGYEPLDESEFGFAKQLLRFCQKTDETEARLVAKHDTRDSGDLSFNIPVPIGSTLYDKDNPPVILYLDADKEEDWATPSVFMVTKGRFILLSDKMTCKDKGASSVTISGTGGGHVIKGVSGGITGGIGSDGKSFWASTSKQFVLYRQHGCTLVNDRASHDYKPFGERLFQVSYQGETVHDLPLGVWIDVSGDREPVVKGSILSISRDGKLLIAE